MIKPQYVDQIPKAVKGTVQQLLDKKNERNNIEEICDFLGMLVYLSIIIYYCYLLYIYINLYYYLYHFYFLDWYTLIYV